MFQHLEIIREMTQDTNEINRTGVMKCFRQDTDFGSLAT